MKYHVTDMDRRFSHSASFRYMLRFSKPIWGNGTGVLDFDRARRGFNSRQVHHKEVCENEK